MRDEKKLELAKKASNLIATITAKNISQKEISTLTGISKATLSKLKGVEYFPGTGEAMIEKLEKLADALENNPIKALAPLFTQKREKKKIGVLLCSLISLVLGLFLGYLIFGGEQNQERKEKISVEEAFETLFETNAQVKPYSVNTNLPCYKFQNKWELDEKNPYTIVLDLNEGVYYYRAKSVSLYAWCEIGNANGDTLEALELFTNELWLDTKNRRGEVDSLKQVNFADDNGFIKLAEVSSIFSDVIGFGYNEEKKCDEPVSREGKRIARYYESFIAPGYEAQVTEVVENHISKLRKTECNSVLVLGNDSNMAEDLILQFNCTFFKGPNATMAAQHYHKRIKKTK